MFAKIILATLVLGSIAGALNASSMLEDEQPQNKQSAAGVASTPILRPSSTFAAKQGYRLVIFSPCEATNFIVNAVEAIGFGVRLKKEDGTYPQGWYAKITAIDENMRCEGFPVVVAGQKKKALFISDISENAAISDDVVVCDDDLKLGDFVTCKRLLYIPYDILTKPVNGIPGFLYFADKLAKPCKAV